mgnify:CR=1 FL=1
MTLQLFDNKKKEILFFTLLLIIFYRSPYILLQGRFAAEEGTLYFANAYKYGFFYSLLFVDFKSGYLNLWANISGILANLFTLKLAPLASNYLALVPKLLIFYFILYKESYLIDKFKHKLVLCLLILISPFNVPEIWLNSINSQIFFCILSFLIVLNKNEKNNINYLSLFIILISGFTGVYTCVLLPILFFKYLKFKTMQDKYNLIVLSLCTIVQFSIVIFAKTKNILYQGKLHTVDIDLIHNYLYNVPIKAFLGRNLTQFIYNNLNISIKLAFFLICIFGLLIIAYLIYYFKKNINIFKNNKFIINSLLYSFFSISLLVLVGAVGPYVGGRYAALPSFFLITTALFLLIVMKNSNFKFFFYLIIFISIISGAYEFKNNTKYKKHLLCFNCPNWSEEVKKFKKNNDYPLKIWPYTMKKRMYLN